MPFLWLKVETPLLFDAIYSCPGIALLCQVRFCFLMKGIPWSDLGVRLVTFPPFNCLCTPKRCEDRQLLSRHNIDTARWLSRHGPLLLICPDRPCTTWMIAGVTSQIREKWKWNKKEKSSSSKMGRTKMKSYCSVLYTQLLQLHPLSFLRLLWADGMVAPAVHCGGVSGGFIVLSVAEREAGQDA